MDRDAGFDVERERAVLPEAEAQGDFAEARDRDVTFEGGVEFTRRHAGVVRRDGPHARPREPRPGAKP